MSGVPFQLSVARNALRPASVGALLSDAAALIGMFVLVLRRWSQLGPFPPGLDGAQWLALGRGLHGFGRSSQGAYAPLVPLLTHAADVALGPLPAVRLLATLSALAVSLAVWLVARAILGPLWGFVAAAFVISTSALAEPLFYGGYPQQLAFAAGIVALGAACLFLGSGANSLLALVGAFGFVSASAHHLYFPLILLSLLMATLAWLSHPANRSRWRCVRPLLLSLLPALITSGVIAYQFAVASYAAPLSATSRSPLATWQYVTRESPLIWCVLALLAVALLSVTWHKRGEAAWLFTFALMVPFATLLLPFGQPRLAPPLLLGIALAVAFGARTVVPLGMPSSRVALVASMVALALAVLADRASSEFAAYYQVVDGSLLDAAAAIASHDESGAVAVRQDHRGWPIGWWFEALQTRPVYTDSDLQWLGFPDERLRARQAAELFDGRLDAATFMARTSALGVRYLVIPKWDWIGWDRWLRESQFPVQVIFDDDHYLVLLVSS